MIFESYSVLSAYYDKLISDCDYDKWSQYLLNKIETFAPGKKGLDLACGSGKMTFLLSDAGYKMSGADISDNMLMIAKKISDDNRKKVSFFKTDLNKPLSNEKYDFITVVNDGFNYVKQSNLDKSFKAIKRLLNKNGLLIFDISSEHKLKNIIGNNLFGEDLDKISYLWFNTLYPDRVEMDLSFFIKKGELYEKKEEKHTQYIHSVEFVLSKLKENGFKPVFVEGNFGLPLREDSDRINFGVVLDG